MNEFMTCCVCGAKWESAKDGSTDWRAMDAGGQRFHFCPKEFPPPGAPAEEFRKAKEKMQARVLELIENAPPLKCQVCGCTELNPCLTDGQPCAWIAPGVLCDACLPKVPLPRTERELMEVFAPILGGGFNVPIAGLQAFYILSSLQLVLLHPDYPPHLSELVMQFAEGLQRSISVTPALAALCAAGWDRAQDVQKERRIIVPGEF
jgi:hypothetical protein